MPNLQDRRLAADVTQNEKNYWHCVNKLDTWSLTWEDVHLSNAWIPPKEFLHLPVSVLLYGFFEFYGFRFPPMYCAVSIKAGAIVNLKGGHKQNFLCIEDPFETFDSHSPHDLGNPAGESKGRDIMEFLRDSESHLRKLLCGEKGGLSLWSKPSSQNSEREARRRRNAATKKDAKGPRTGGQGTGKTKQKSRNKNYGKRRGGKGIQRAVPA